MSLLGLLAGTTVSAEKLAKKELAAQPIELLGGRLEARGFLASGARIEQRQRSIMSAVESSQEESRVVVEAEPDRPSLAPEGRGVRREPEKLVVMVYELFS